MQGYQFARTWNMVSHFSEHQSRTPNLSFFGLLVQHYSHIDMEQQDDDNTEDAQLPFKSTVSSSFILFFSPQLPIVEAVLCVPDAKLGEAVVSSYVFLLYGSVFRPPSC
jgi:hypothetical protein